MAFWQDPSTPITIRPFLTQETAQERLKYLKGVLGHTWPEIAESAEFSPIPAGTLYNIMTTGEVPKKWWSRLNIRATPFTERVAIHKFNMESAARTILNNIEISNVQELIDILIIEKRKIEWREMYE